MAYTAWLNAANVPSPVAAPGAAPIWDLTTNNGVESAIAIQSHLTSIRYFMEVAMTVIQSGCVFRMSPEGYCIHDTAPELGFPASLAPDARISAPIFLFHVLISDRSAVVQSAMFAWAEAARVKDDAARGRQLTIMEKAIIVVAAYFNDICGTHPLLAKAFTVGHPSLRELVSIATRRLRHSFITMARTDAALETVITTPWNIASDSPFFSMLARAISQSCVQFTTVEIAPGPVPPVISFVINECRGVVVSPIDKLLVLIVLLFVCEFDLGAGLRIRGRAGMAATGVPDPILDFISTARRTHPIPIYYGPDHGFSSSSDWDEP